MKFHLSNLFNGRKALAEQEEASGEMNILKAGLLEKPESAIAQARLAAKLMFDERCVNTGCRASKGLRRKCLYAD